MHVFGYGHLANDLFKNILPLFSNKDLPIGTKILFIFFQFKCVLDGVAEPVRSVAIPISFSIGQPKKLGF